MVSVRYGGSVLDGQFVRIWCNGAKDYTHMACIYSPLAIDTDGCWQTFLNSVRMLGW